MAVLEAKKENSSATPGLQQVQNYAKRFNVPFAFSTNGKLFSGFGADTGLISYEKPLGQFPAPVDLLNRYQRSKSKGRRYRIFFEVAVR